MWIRQKKKKKTSVALTFGNVHFLAGSSNSCCNVLTTEIVAILRCQTIPPCYSLDCSSSLVVAFFFSSLLTAVSEPAFLINY